MEIRLANKEGRGDAITTPGEREASSLRVPAGGPTGRGLVDVTLHATNAFLMNPRLMDSFFFLLSLFGRYELCKRVRARARARDREFKRALSPPPPPSELLTTTYK